MDVCEGDICLAALNASHVRSVNVATVSQFLLGYSFLHAQGAHTLAELKCDGIRH
jgi:hypothetical protein